VVPSLDDKKKYTILYQLII
jgi:hypothetical protein